MEAQLTSKGHNSPTSSTMEDGTVSMPSVLNLSGRVVKYICYYCCAIQHHPVKKIEAILSLYTPSTIPWLHKSALIAIVSPPMPLSGTGDRDI